MGKIIQSIPILLYECQFSLKIFNFAKLVVNICMKFKFNFSSQFSPDITNVRTQSFPTIQHGTPPRIDRENYIGISRRNLGLDFKN